MEALSRVINLQGLLIAVPLVILVLLFVRLYTKKKRSVRQKPGQYLEYTVPGRTAAECRGLLGQPQPSDLFSYSLQSAPGGGWYLHFTLHNPTAQPLDTLFLLQFTAEEPAGFCLQFVREAFGMREPVIGEGLLDDFFSQKLGALRQAAGGNAP